MEPQEVELVEVPVTEKVGTAAAVDENPFLPPPDCSITIPRGKPRVVKFRFPTDDQWRARQSARRLVSRSGRSDFEATGGEAADKFLMKELEIDVPEDLTAVEAARILNAISHTEIVDVQTGSDYYTVIALLPTQVEVTVQFRIPTLDEVETYRKRVSKIRPLPRGGMEMVTNTKAAADLFDTICETPAAKALSIVFKTPMVAEVVAEIDRMLEPNRPE